MVKIDQNNKMSNLKCRSPFTLEFGVRQYKIIFFLLLVFLCFFFFACSNPFYPFKKVIPDDVLPALPGAVTGVSLDKSSLTLLINHGETLTLTATVNPADANNKTVSWSSSNTNIATVDSNGKITPVSNGTVTITVTTNDGNKTASCTVTVNTSVITMVPISAGTFIMGSPDNEPLRDTDELQRQITLTKGFYAGIFPVTQGQWKAVMNGTNPSDFNTNDNLPVERVSWYDMIVFCNRLSEQEGLSPVYEIQETEGDNSSWTTDTGKWGAVPGSNNTRWNAVRIVPNSNGYRLPTEAQWEYACRAGTTTAYNTGISINVSQANFNLSNTTTVQGTYLPNAWGLYDKHGNVWEWCWDWYDASYTSGDQIDPVGPAFGSEKVVRGGSFASTNQRIRSAHRGSNYPSFSSDRDSFRLVRPVQ